jgi:hypothetical protein
MFGASSLPRIIKCPASVQESLKNPVQPSSPAAEQGTILHDIIATALKSNNPADYIHQTSLSLEDTAYLLDCWDFIGTLPASNADDRYIEVQGSLTEYDLPEVWGTADYVQVSPYGSEGVRMDVIDWKFGHGVPVHAKKNYQLVAYLGMATSHLFSQTKQLPEMWVHICQPPLGIFESWKVEPAELEQMILGDITDAIRMAKSSNPPYNPSKYTCIFCGGKHTCPARKKYLKESMQMITKAAQSPSELGKDNAFWAEFLDRAEVVKQAIRKVEEYAIEELKAGRPVGDYKLVEGRATRKFIDPEAGKQFIINRLEDKAWKPREVVSLAQAEKIDRTLKSDPDWQNLIYKPSGKLKLAAGTDKRPAVTTTVSDVMYKLASGRM